MKKLYLLRFAFLIILFTPLLNLSATVYYVSSLGNDSSNGTSNSTPWKTIARVNAQHFTGGDKILFKGNEIFYGTLVFNTNNVSNTTLINISVGSYAIGIATIKADKSSGIFVYNVAGIKISDLNIKGGWLDTLQKGNSGAGIDIYTDQSRLKKLKGISVMRCDISGFKNGGIVIGAWPKDNSQAGFDNISISNCKLHDNGDCGISSYGYYPATPADTVYSHTNIYIGWNYCYNNLGIKGKGNNSGNGIVLGQTKGAVIEHCIAYNNGWMSDYPYAGPAGIWCYDSKNITIQFNEAHDNGTGPGTPDGDGFDFDGGVLNSVMQYNYSHHNFGAGYLIYEYGVPRTNNHNNIIRYNISENDAYGSPDYSCIYLKNKCDSNKIYNNTVYSSVSNPLYVGNNYGVGNYFVNNIFYGNKPGLFAAYINSNSNKFLNNNYYSGLNPLMIFYNGTIYSSLALFRTTGQETLNDINYGFDSNPMIANPGYGGNINTGDPSILNNYLLKSKSPLINTGFNTSSLGWWPCTKDFKGLNIPQGGIYDLGACEYAQLNAFAENNITVQKDNVSIGFYPNPAKDFLYIASNKNIKEIKITDFLGRIVASQQLNVSNASINIHYIKSGIYIMQALDATGKILASEKLIKE